MGKPLFPGFKSSHGEYDILTLCPNSWYNPRNMHRLTQQATKGLSYMEATERSVRFSYFCLYDFFVFAKWSIQQWYLSLLQLALEQHIYMGIFATRKEACRREHIMCWCTFIAKWMQIFNSRTHKDGCRNKINHHTVFGQHSNFMCQFFVWFGIWNLSLVVGNLSTPFSMSLF